MIVPAIFAVQVIRLSRNKWTENFKRDTDIFNKILEKLLWEYHILVMYQAVDFRSSRAEVFFKKVVLKISQESQENTSCAGVSFQ